MVETTIKAIFFDVRDTLGYVDRPGHLVLYKPSTTDLLQSVQAPIGARIGVITNLPKSVSAAEGRRMLEDAGLMKFLDPQGVVINHEAGSDKPSPDIFAFAARQMGLAPDQCLFVGENFAEVLGAQAAGMKAVLKPCPPGREFMFKPVAPRAGTMVDSGRLAETVMEEDHLIGRRLVIAAAMMARRIAETGEAPVRAMGLLTFLLQEFIDGYHHRVEERVLLPLAFAFGLPRSDADYIYADHDRGRAHFDVLDAALKRIQGGQPSAYHDFQTELEGFVTLYRSHARRENDETLPAIGRLLTPNDDALIVELMGRYGPGDLGPWLLLIADLERELGIDPEEKKMPEIKTVGVIAYPRCGEQDTLVPYEILRHTSMVLGQQKPARQLTVSLLRPRASDPELVEMQMGTRVMSDGAIGDDLVDLLYIPGGMGSGAASQDQVLLDLVRRHHAAGKVVATNCSGISVLHRAGILGETPVTAAATVSRRLLEEGAKVLQPRTMWAGQKDGLIWTSAGGSGVHGSVMAMVCNYFGREVGTFIGMGWDTYPAYGDAIFEERGPQYFSFPALEAGIQDALEDILLPRPPAGGTN